MMQQEPLNLNGTTIRRVPNSLNPLHPTEYEFRSGSAGDGGAAAAGGLLLHPAIILLAILALVVFLVYQIYRRVIKPLCRWIFKVEQRARVGKNAAIPHEFITRQGAIHRERSAIEAAMEANPDDPGLLPRIESLTAEVERFDRVVLQKYNQPAQDAFGEGRGEGS
jgi:hypothetical protein